MFVGICIDFREACYINLDTKHGVADVRPLAALFVPVQAV